mgnify:FL=1
MKFKKEKEKTTFDTVTAINALRLLIEAVDALRGVYRFGVEALYRLRAATVVRCGQPIVGCSRKRRSDSANTTIISRSRA